MTGKFTQNVFDLGVGAGRMVHRLALSTNGLSATCLPTLGNFDASSVLSSIVDAATSLPNRYRLWWLNLLRSDPLHVLVETLLIVMCIFLIALQRRADWRFAQERKKGAPTDAEVEELLREWKANRKPLGKGGEGRVGASAEGAPPKKLRAGTGLVVEKIEGGRLYLQVDDSSVSTGGSGGGAATDSKLSVIDERSPPESARNFATTDYLASSSSPALRSVARSALSKYGCGSCGPRGFYGTIDAHLEVEEAMSEFLGTEQAILYSDGASAATSTVAAFAKRGDLLIVDEGVSEALLVGVTLSRANVRYFRHNDVKDLRRVLERVAAQDATLKRKATDQRRFLVVEGLYRNWGTIAPLREIVKLKEEFHYRLILDDSHGIGTLGANGRGSLEHHGLKPMVHCEILTFSLENALGSVGGMTVGSEEVVDHQRLSGAGYCFSASAPPFLSKVCLANVRRLEGRMDEVIEDLEEEEEENVTSVGGDDLDVDNMKVSDLKAELKKRGLGVSGRKAELQQRLRDHISISNQSTSEELSGPPLMRRLHQNISALYGTLTNLSHPHALKLRNKLSITSDPQSPILYLRLTDEEAAGQTRAEQTEILDNVAQNCLVEGEVAIVSTGGHVKKFLQLVPEPCLRVVTNSSQTAEDVEALAKALGEAVEAAMVRGN
ncbi:hypothetical protein ACHAXT_001954 [Thalassiosira profunda]